MLDGDFVFITDFFDQMVDSQKKIKQNVFSGKKFNGIKEVFIKIPAKHPCVMCLYRVSLSIKSLVDQNLISNERKPSLHEGR